MPPGCSSTLPARFGTWFQLVFGAHHVPLPYSALWGQCHPPEAWSCEHMDTHGHMVGIQHRRGDGLWGMKGLFGKSPDPALNVQGL